MTRIAPQAIEPCPPPSLEGKNQGVAATIVAPACADGQRLAKQPDHFAAQMTQCGIDERQGVAGRLGAAWAEPEISAFRHPVDHENLIRRQQVVNDLG